MTSYSRKSGSNKTEALILTDVMHCTKIVIICKNCEDYQFTGEGNPGIYKASNEQPT